MSTYRKEYYEKNKEKAMKQQKTYYEKNKDKIYDYQKNYYSEKYKNDINFRIKHKEYDKEYYRIKNNLDKIECSIKFIKLKDQVNINVDNINLNRIV